MRYAISGGKVVEWRRSSRRLLASLAIPSCKLVRYRRVLPTKKANTGLRHIHPSQIQYHHISCSSHCFRSSPTGAHTTASISSVAMSSNGSRM
jgi:hypothetical protein